MIYRGDLLSSCVLGTRPRFPILPLSTSLQDLPLHSTLPFEEAPDTIANHAALRLIYQNLRYLTVRMPQRSSNPINMLAFCRARSSIEYALLSLSFVSPSSRYSSLAESEFEARRLGAFLYAEAALRDCVAKGAFIRHLQSQIIVAIQKCDEFTTGSLWGGKITLWVYCTAGLFDLEEGVQKWFAYRIVGAMEIAGIQRWEEVEGLLREVMWTNALTKKVMGVLWPQVQSVRRDLLDVIS